MRISQYYGLPNPGHLPFVDVNVCKDSRLYLDPHAIRLDRSKDRYVDDAKASMTTFFDTVRQCLVCEDEFSRARGLQLLQGFTEPWQTRLGLAAHGFHGHGGADLVGQWIWETLATNADAFRRIALFTQLEDIPLFVPGIGADITSDLTTRIVFQPLADFTAKMVAIYPQFTAGTHKVTPATTRVWDPATCSWRESEVTLPVANGKELLLVPRHWARPMLLMHARRFYDTSVLGHIQEQETIYTSKGMLEPTKEALKHRPDLSCTRAFILGAALKAGDEGINLNNAFKTYVDAHYKAVPDDVLNRKTA